MSIDLKNSITLVTRKNENYQLAPLILKTRSRLHDIDFWISISFGDLFILLECTLIDSLTICFVYGAWSHFLSYQVCDSCDIAGVLFSRNEREGVTRKQTVVMKLQLSMWKFVVEIFSVNKECMSF